MASFLQKYLYSMTNLNICLAKIQVQKLNLSMFRTRPSPTSVNHTHFQKTIVPHNHFRPLNHPVVYLNSPFWCFFFDFIERSLTVHIKRILRQYTQTISRFDVHCASASSLFKEASNKSSINCCTWCYLRVFGRGPVQTP